jgi:hypothetical protein
MVMTDIEIPLKADRHFWYRVFEILPGALSWLTIAAPALLAIFDPLIAAYAITVYLIVWFIRSMTMAVRTLQSYSIMQLHRTMDWQPLIDDLMHAKDRKPIAQHKWHSANVESFLEAHADSDLTDKNLVHAIVMPFHREGREILQPSIEALASARYDMKKVIIVLTAEERAGPESGILAHELAKEFAGVFKHVIATVHPADLPGEQKGKGPNANWGMRELQKYVDTQGIDYSKVVITSLDCDHRIDTNYLAALTYFYLACPDRLHTSFQPISMFTNNIWDAPAPMRVIATGNSFWSMIVSTRQHVLRNFASHAQSLEAMVATNFYTTRSVVEDGHQFWRSYFRFDGNHEVFPLFTPIYQDAVLAGSFRKTFKEQFVQLRRWAYGASDVAYVAHTGYFKKNSISKVDITMKLLRLIEGHVSWATSALLLLFAALVPVYVNPSAKHSVVANQLPVIASHIQQVALIGILATLYLSLKLLPPRPARYAKWRYIPMALQWFLMPVVSIFFASTAALNSQTRLMFGRYLDVFNATIKVVKK